MGGVVARGLAAGGHTVFSFGRRDIEAIGRPLPNYTRWDLLAGPINVPRVDAVVHCAAKVGDWGLLSEYREVNVEGTGVVMEVFSQADRFVHVSSASVYSTNQSGQDMAEDDSVGQCLHSAYAVSKFEVEQRVLTRERGAVILRPHVVYGPGDTTLMPRLLKARRFGWLVVPGNGRNLISVTHVFNFVHAVERLLNSTVGSGIFNVADAEPARLDELLRTLLRRNDVSERMLYVPRSVAWRLAVANENLCSLVRRRSSPGLTRYMVAHVADVNTLDLSRAYQKLGYTPQYGFRDGPLQEDCPE